MKNPNEEAHYTGEITGILLAGGTSRRMGQDKALITVNGQPLWQRCRETLAMVCSELLLAGDRPDLTSTGLPGFADTWPGSSLAGLHTGLTHARTDWVTVLPCDLPYPSPLLLRTLQGYCSDSVQAVVPRTRLGREPLIACYQQNCLPQITRRLETGTVKILDLLDELEVLYIDEADLPPGWRRSLRNINTPAELERLQHPPPAVSFVARSGTGKTTLIEKLIAELTSDGWTIGALKHDAHKFEIDHAGKDSWRLSRAGAAVTSISSPARTATIYQHELEPTLDQLLEPFAGEVDLIVTEGFKKSSLPKIEVHRADLNQPLLCRGEANDPTLLAIASDTPLDVDVPVLALDDAANLGCFIVEALLR